jgi:hypothetical protein
MSMSASSLPVLEIGLNALSTILDKAEAHAEARKIDPSVLLNARLFPDMFAFTRQVQVVCDQAKNATSRLAQVEPPKFEDNEKTFPELKARIAKTLAYLKTLDAAKIDASADREIVFPLGPTKKGHMRGADYSITSCCRTTTSTSRRPTTSSDTTASRSASSTFWARCRLP